MIGIWASCLIWIKSMKKYYVLGGGTDNFGFVFCFWISAVVLHLKKNHEIEIIFIY